MAKRGKLIVIEGTDGSGKNTQAKLLAERLHKEGCTVKTINFPQYGKESARLVEQYLAGEFGPIESIDPHEVAKYYAWDRKDAAPVMQTWLEQGNIVISNRYQQSNKGHQACKFDDPKERMEFIKWIDDLEFNQYNIPKSDAVVFLHVPTEIAQSLVTKRGNKKDIHESNIEYLKKTEQTYLEIANKEKWIIIECVKDGKLMPEEQIHGMVWENIKKIV